MIFIIIKCVSLCFTFYIPENLFSVYRASITTPTPLIFKRKTKLIGLGHLLTKPKGKTELFLARLCIVNPHYINVMGKTY